MLSDEQLETIIDNLVFVPDNSTVIVTPPSKYMIDAAGAFAEASRIANLPERGITIMVIPKELFSGVYRGDAAQLAHAVNRLAAMSQSGGESHHKENVMSKPFVGQHARYYPPYGNVWRSAAPLAAIVTQVFNDRHVCLSVFKPDGSPMQSPPDQVVVCLEGEERPETQPSCVLVAGAPVAVQSTTAEKPPCGDCGGTAPVVQPDPTPLTTISLDHPVPSSDPPLPSHAGTVEPLSLDPTGTTQVNPPSLDS